MLGRARVATFMYHEITDDPTDSGFQRRAARPFTCSRATFAGHLQEIEASALTPQLVPTLDPTKTGRGLLLTFDDGGRSALYAADELERRGWKGHFFVVTGRVGERTFLSAAGIRQLHAAGHLVGSHSHTHPDIMRDLSRPAVLREWAVSCDIVAQIVGDSCRAASVPGGDISRMVLDTAAEAGLDYLFTSEPWLVPRRVGNCWVFGRFAVKRSTSAAALRERLRFRGWKRALLARHLRSLARRGLGPLYREYVRRRTLALEGPMPVA
jgi:peptidoglycan/xylan/chitin deacetylase (PgdA/CDA1 family)